MNLNLKGLTIKAKKPRIIIKNHHQCKTGFATLLQAAFLRKMEASSDCPSCVRQPDHLVKKDT